jgi:ATP-dependent RNA helicase RhlE
MPFHMTASFAEFGLADPLARALVSAGYVTPTPIQAQAIPHLLAGRDLLGLAETGTGKTAAFVLPILQALRGLGTRPEPGTVRALILAPTRELAVQIHETVRMFSKGQHFAHAAVFGGVSINPQIDALRRGVDVLIATPGRLMDLLMQRKARLDGVTHFVLDEADRMLDMGFIRDVRKIIGLLPARRQSMLFSATMPESIDEIVRGLLNNPVMVEVRKEAVPVDRIAQHIVHLPISAKKSALLKLLAQRDVTRAMVFARTKHGANRLGEYLEEYGLSVGIIHGNKSQGARQKALNGFKTGEVKILVATDIAARGIDVSDVSHVINAELPDEPESYVHRIGRTARAGRAGIAITLCSPDERDKLRAIERLTRRALAPMVIEGFELPTGAGDGAISDQRSPRGARPQGRPAAGRGGARPQEGRSADPRFARPVREEPRGERSAPRAGQDRPRNDLARNDRPRSDHARNERPHAERGPDRGHERGHDRGLDRGVTPGFDGAPRPRFLEPRGARPAAEARPQRSQTRRP